MLTHSQTPIADTDITGHSYWRCPKGHHTPVWLCFQELSLLRSSAWDWCDHCSHHPSDADQTRMELQIYGRWLRDRLIDQDTYHKMAHTAVNRYPHLQRQRLQNLLQQIQEDALDPLHVTEEDRRLILRAAIGLH